MTRVSVLMSVFNAEDYLEEAVESILAQSFSDFEFLIFDDGSTDRSPEILERFASEDSRIRCFRRNHAGLTPMLVEGIEIARGTYVARIDADDVADPNRLERQCAFLDEHDDCVIVGSDALFVDPEGWPLRRVDVHTDHDPTEAKLLRGEGLALIHSTVMMRRKAVLSVGNYRPEYCHAEDLDLFLRMAEIGRLANLPDVLLRIRQHLGKVCYQSAEAQRRMINRILEEAWQRRGQSLPQTLRLAPLAAVVTPTEIWCEWTRTAITGGELATARKHVRRVLAAEPLRARSWQLLIRALLGIDIAPLKRRLAAWRGSPVEKNTVTAHDFCTIPAENAVAVACTFDESYAMPTCVMLRSALDGLAPDRHLHVFAIGAGIQPETRNRIAASLDSHRVTLNWIPAPEQAVAHLDLPGRFPLVAYSRILLPELLPPEISRVIYLDCDLIVEGDLTELWNEPTEDAALLAIQDTGAPVVSAPRGLLNYRELGLDPKTPYFNAGVLVFQLERWRELGLAQRVLHYLEENLNTARWPDQDGLNAVLPGHWRSIDPRWNQMPDLLEFESWEDSAYEKDVYEAILTDPQIIHFAAESKPWQWGNDHPKKHRFFEVLERTAFAGFTPRRSWRDTRVAKGLARRRVRFQNWLRGRTA